MFPPSPEAMLLTGLGGNSSFIVMCRKRVKHNLLPWPFLYMLEYRVKDGVHLNPCVGRVQLEDDDPEGSMFEFGITDQIQMPGANNKKRKADTFNMWVHACGSQWQQNSELCQWFLWKFVICAPDPEKLRRQIKESICTLATRLVLKF